MSPDNVKARPSWLRDSSLSLFFGAILLATLVGQAFTGLAEYNSSVQIDGLPTLTLGAYVTSAQFAVDVAENWQSEYLQFLLYIVITVWLVQRGSTESKAVEDRGRESDEEQKVGRFAASDSPAWARAAGWRKAVFSHSLSLAMGAFFLLSWGAQLVAGTSADNSQRLQKFQALDDGVCRLARLLEPDAAELAVGVPGCRQHGGPEHLSARAGFARVETGGLEQRGHRCGRLTGLCRQRDPRPGRSPPFDVRAAGYSTGGSLSLDQHGSAHVQRRHRPATRRPQGGAQALP